jgi:hypothetical protein
LTRMLAAVVSDSLTRERTLKIEKLLARVRATALNIRMIYPVIEWYRRGLVSVE